MDHGNWKRGPDLNRRPSGYGPDELPLLHPAEYDSSCCSFYFIRADFMRVQAKANSRTKNPVRLILRKIVWPLIDSLGGNSQCLSQFSW